MFKILLCGDRDWTDESLIRRKLMDMQITHPGPYLVIHGNARGADQIGGRVALSLHMNVHSFPAEWEKYGRAAGIKRNQVMLEQNPDIVMAFHDGISQSKGTKDMLNRAYKAGIYCYLIQHNGITTWPIPVEEVKDIEF